MEKGLILEQSTLFIVVTLDPEGVLGRVSIIHHPEEEEPMSFTRQDVYQLLYHSLLKKKEYAEMFVIGFHQVYFYTKFSKTPHYNEQIEFGDGLNEIGNIYYYTAF